MITFFSLSIGILINIEIFTRWFDFLFSSLLPFLISEIVGLIISIMEIFVSANFINRLLAIISPALNIIPLGYFIFLCLSIG